MLALNFQMATVSEWNSTVTYNIPDVVLYNGEYYTSKTNNNINNTPSNPSSNWAIQYGTVGNSQQTWASYAGARLPSTVYTNTTGAAIQVVISLSVAGPASRILVVDSINFPLDTSLGTGSFGTSLVHNVIIPAGSAYFYNGTFTSWLELR